MRTDFSSYPTVLKFMLFVQRLLFSFQFLPSPVVLFVVLVLRRMFYIKERKLPRLFRCYLSNKIRTIICQNKNMKKVLKKDQKQQSDNISRLYICICHESHGVFFKASSLAFGK